MTKTTTVELSYSLTIVHNSFANKQAALIAMTKITAKDKAVLPKAGKVELKDGIILANNNGMVVVQYCRKVLLRVI